MSLLFSIKRQFAHDAWAKGKLADAVRDLTDPEFSSDFGEGFGSVQSKFCHMVDAEDIWLQRIVNKVSPTARPDDMRHKTREEFLKWNEELRTRKLKLVESLTEQGLRTDISYKAISGRAYTMPLFEVLQHVMLHAAYHRGQVAACLRALGRTPPSTDFVEYIREEPAKVP